MGHGDDLLSLTRFLYLTISPQLLQQRLGLAQIGRVKALGEPAVDWRQEVAGFDSLTLALPQARQTHRSAQLPPSRLLLASDGERLLKTRRCLSHAVHRLCQEQFSPKAIELRFVESLLPVLGCSTGLSQHVETCRTLACFPVPFGEECEVGRSCYFSPCRPPGGEALVHLCYP